MDRRALWMRALALTLLPLALGAGKPAQGPALRAVLIGGGPEPTYNQVAIESNVRWMDALLPGKVPRTVLFCDGRTDSAIVQFARETSDAEEIMRMLYGDGGPHQDERFLKYRPTQLKKIDGPSSADAIQKAISDAGTGKELLLYFTGHGSPGPPTPDGNRYDANRYDLWKAPGLTPAALAAQIKALPKDVPVTVIMVQCFSGAFGNLLFEDASPTGAPIDRPICGFFAATREREAAGCTPEVDEAEYKDFTSYFFAALTGKDRVGRTVPAPDYDKNGSVGMDEAYAYALITDASIDVPVSTSDVFLRRYVPVTQDSDILETSWESLYAAATPAQKAALDGLSAAIGPRAQTPERVRTALNEFQRRLREGEGEMLVSPATQSGIRRWRKTLADKFPGLAALRPGPTGNNASRDDRALYAADFKRAVAYLEETPEAFKELKEFRTRLDEAEKRAAADAILGARWLRLLRLSKSVVLEMRLRKGGDKDLIARLDALKKRESANPITG